MKNIAIKHMFHVRFVQKQSEKARIVTEKKSFFAKYAEQKQKMGMTFVIHAITGNAKNPIKGLQIKIKNVIVKLSIYLLF